MRIASTDNSNIKRMSTESPPDGDAATMTSVMAEQQDHNRSRLPAMPPPPGATFDGSVSRLLRDVIRTLHPRLPTKLARNFNPLV
jgi:hypothetical protein